MRQVVLKTNESHINVENVFYAKYYGVKHLHKVGFIRRLGYYVDDYKVYSFNEMTQSIGAYSRDTTIRGIITYLLKTANTQVFEFDTWQELLKWAIEEG